MKKVELIALLLTYPNIGDVTKEVLEKHKMKDLWVLKNEMDEELKKEDTTIPDQKPEPVKTDAKAEPVKTDAKPGTKELFIPMCGITDGFDPNKKSSCNLQCVKDYPDSHAECLTHFKTLADEKKASKPKGLGMNQWYHRPGTQGSNLDEFFTTGKIGTVKEIAEFADCNERRVMIHIKHLIWDFDVEILKGQKKNDTGKIFEAYFCADKDKRRKGTKVSGKTGFPQGFPEHHPCFGKKEGEDGIIQ